MRNSQPIEARGRFIGVAVTQPPGWRVIAIDPAIEPIQGASFASAAEARHAARLALTRACAHAGYPATAAVRTR